MFGFGRGKLEMILDNYTANPSGQITGRITLKLKKPIHARQLRVEFVGLQKDMSTGVSVLGVSNSTNSRSGTGNNQTRTVHKFEMLLDGEKDYLNGEHNFNIAVPGDILKKGALPEGGLGTAMQTVRLLGGTISRTEWHVSAILDILGGMDMCKKLQANIV